MKSLYFNDDHQLFRQSARQFIEAEVLPYAAEWEEKREIPREIWSRMGELGFLGLNLPEEYGGTNLDFFYSVVWTGRGSWLDDGRLCGGASGAPVYVGGTYCQSRQPIYQTTIFNGCY